MSNQLFKSYPSVDVFFRTSDDQYFTEKHHAETHANSLKDNKVEVIKRKKTVKAEPDKTEEAKTEPVEKPKKAKK